MPAPLADSLRRRYGQHTRATGKHRESTGKGNTGALTGTAKALQPGARLTGSAQK